MNVKDNWAAELLEKSNKLSKTTYFPNVFTGHEESLNNISNMFLKFNTLEVPQIRAWVDGGQRYTVIDKLIELTEQKDKSLIKRLADATDSNEFCVTFNGLTSWCTNFAKKTQKEILDPLFKIFGDSSKFGTDFYTFFGNYGYTPFGVHDDTDHSLLWHLGPSSKKAYIWPREIYESITGGTLATQDYETLLPHALSFTLEPGDLLFIPSGDFHILETTDFSVTLGLTIFPESTQLECLDGLKLLVSDSSTYENLPLESFTLQEIIKLRRLSLKSNGFVISQPKLSTVDTVIQENAFYLKNTELYVEPSWPLCVLELSNRTVLLVRKRAIWAQKNEIFTYLSEIFNKFEKISYSKLEKDLIDKINPAELSNLIYKIHKLGGLRIEKKS